MAAGKFLLMAYDTTSNNVLPDLRGDKLSEIKPTLEKLIQAKTHNMLTLQNGPVTVAQYVLNRGKDKWRKTVG